MFGVEEKDENGEKMDMTTEEATITNSTSVMMNTVAGNEYAIGYISLASLDDSVKAVKIDGAEATVDNIKSGAYKVQRPFNIDVYKRQHASDSRGFKKDECCRTGDSGRSEFLERMHGKSSQKTGEIYPRISWKISEYDSGRTYRA